MTEIPNAKKYPTLEEAPIDQIKEASAVHSMVLLYFKRFNLKGQVEALPSRTFETAELLTDAVDEYLRGNYGGGRFIVEVRDIALHSEQIVPRYSITIAGPPKAVGTQNGMESRFAPAAPSMIEMSAGYRTTGQAPLAGGQQVNRPSDFMTHTPDQIALNQVTSLQEEIRTLRRENADRERKAQAEAGRLRQQVEDQRVANERIAAEARDAALRAELAAMREQMRQPAVVAKPAFDLTAMASFMAALVPVLVAMISSGKDRQQLQLTAQQHMSDQQMNMLMALMKKDDGGKSNFDVVMALLPKLMESNNPSKMADVITSMGESQMATLSMAAQAIQALTPEADNPGMAIMRTALDGAMGIAEQFQRNRQLPAQAPQQVLQAPQQQRVVEQPAEVVSAPTAGATPRRTRTAQQIRTPRELAKAIVSDPAWPEDMRSQQWVFLLTTLHSDRPIEAIGEEISVMLEGMMKTDRLAQVLQPMFDEDGPAPSSILRQIFAPLPIAQPEHSERYEAILVDIDEHYTDVEEAPEDAAMQASDAPVEPNGSEPAAPVHEEPPAATPS